MAGYVTPISRWFYQGEPAANGTLDVFQTGTTNRVNIYNDGGLTSLASNPLPLDSNGEAKFYVGTGVALRLDAYTSTGGLIESVDPVYPVSTSNNIAAFVKTLAGGSQATFAMIVTGTANPTAADLGLASLAGIVVHDTTSNVIKVRDQADTTWMTIASVDETNKVVSAVSVAGTTTANNAVNGNVGEYIAASVDGMAATVTTTIATPCVVTWTGHGYAVDAGHNYAMPIVFTTSGALPTGLTAGTVYYVIGSTVTSTTFQVATTIANALAGTAIATTGSQSGTHTGTASIPLTTNTAANVAAISLPAGDWDVGSLVNFTGGSGTSMSNVSMGLSTTSASLPASLTSTNPGPVNFVWAPYSPFGVAPLSFPLPSARFPVGVTTTLYLVALAVFSSSTCRAYGFMGTRRRR